MNRHTDQRRKLEDGLESARARVWQPGRMRAALVANGRWRARLTPTGLSIERHGRSIDYRAESIRSVATRRGLMSHSVVLELEDDGPVRLAGLSRRAANRLRRALRTAAVLATADRLLALAPAAEAHAREWEALVSGSAWLTQSQVARFVAASPTARPNGEAAWLLGSDFADEALGLLDDESARILRFLDCSHIPQAARRRNERFLNAELERHRGFFDRVEKHPLTDEQRRAAVTLDDNVLTVAAAGSGKTSVLVAKAGYAVKSGQVRPDQVLMLAFNRDAALELADRVERYLTPHIADAAKIRVATFHSLGLAIIGQGTGAKPGVAPWVAQGRELVELHRIVETLRSDKDFERDWGVFKTAFATSLPPLHARTEPEWWDPATGRRGFRTLRDETVKSQEERMIANWLAYYGIDYEYERPYEVATASAERVNYHPDFYYPAAGVYHEHFALDREGNAPTHFEPGYVDGVAWKRKLHARRGTTLIETTSHGIRQPDGFQRLAADLLANGVRFGERAPAADAPRRLDEDANILRTFRTFLSHVKSNRLTIEALHERARSRESEHPHRDALFLSLFERIWREWDRRLAQGNHVDFDDMLCRAVDLLAAGEVRLPYRLILADEFQDSSRVRGALLKELSRADDARLFVVGDDWQAVNRFAGADISLMRDFDRYFAPSTTVTLTKTFRCPQDLSDVAAAFVTKNPFQIRKTVVSASARPPPSVLCFQLSDIEEQGEQLRAHVTQLAQQRRALAGPDTVSAYVLGRYRADRPSDFDVLQAEVADVVDLRWSTIHSAKGLEADYVFLVNVVEAIRGFPSKIADDATLWIAMPDGEDFPYAEERRLFYVALTRAKRLVTIYTDVRRRSEFVLELERQGIEMRMAGGDDRPREDCPRCMAGILVAREGRYGPFLGCSRFPACDYTQQVRRAARRARR